MTTYEPADEIALVLSGEAYFSRLLQLLDTAEVRIDLQTYIFENDETGRSVAEALKRAARRGVRVRVLLDGFGSKDLPEPLLTDMRDAGVELRFFKLLISVWKWSSGRTLHHKVVVVDSCRALVGGINIADKYHGSPDEPAWLDFSVFIRGQVCGHLEQLCESIFLHQYWKRPTRASKTKAPDKGNSRKGMLRFRQNDWMRRKTEVYQSYRQGISGSSETLVIAASYFLPGDTLQRRLAAAARRGVKVEVLLTGPSDVQLSRLAERYLASWLIRNGIRVFHWEKSVLHAKAILADNRWASVGSYNINRLSRFRSVELNVDIQDPAFLKSFGLYLDDLLHNQCTEVTASTINLSGWWEHLKARLAYYLVYFLMRLLFPQRRTV